MLNNACFSNDFLTFSHYNTIKNNENIKATLVVGNKNIANFLNGSNLSNNNLNLNILGILNDDDDGKNDFQIDRKCLEKLLPPSECRHLRSRWGSVDHKRS